MFDCKEKLDASHPLTPMSDQDRIPPYNIKQTSDENKEKYPRRSKTKFSKLTSQEL